MSCWRFLWREASKWSSGDSASSFFHWVGVICMEVFALSVTMGATWSAGMSEKEQRVSAIFLRKELQSVGVSEAGLPGVSEAGLAGVVLDGLGLSGVDGCIVDEDGKVDVLCCCCCCCC